MKKSTIIQRMWIAFGIAVVVSIIMTIVFKLRFYDAVNNDLTKTRGEYETLVGATGKGTMAALGEQLKAKSVAELNADLAKRQTDAFRQRFRSLNFDLRTKGATEATFRRYLNEYYTDFGIEMRRQIIQAADESGVIVSTAVKVQNPPQNPEDVTAPPSGFLKPLTDASIGMTVKGTLPNILRFFDRINQSEILMTVGNAATPGVKLENASPNITATFTLTPYLLASGPSAVLPEGVAPAAAGGAAAGGEGGAATGGATPGATPTPTP